MLSFLPATPSEMMETIKSKFRQRRKALGYTQAELAKRSGVSLGSLKRFERTVYCCIEEVFATICYATFHIKVQGLNQVDLPILYYQNSL